MKINNTQKKYFYMALNFSSLFILILSLSSIVQAAIAKDFVDKKNSIQVPINDQSMPKIKHKQMHNNNIAHKHSGNDKTVIHEQSSWKTDHANWSITTLGIDITDAAAVNKFIGKNKQQDNIHIDGNSLQMSNDENNSTGKRAKKLRKDALNLRNKASEALRNAREFARNREIKKVREKQRIINNAYKKIKKIKKLSNNKEFKTYTKTKNMISILTNDVAWASGEIKKIIKRIDVSKSSKTKPLGKNRDSIKVVTTLPAKSKVVPGSPRALEIEETTPFVSDISKNPEKKHIINIEVKETDTIIFLKNDKDCTLNKNLTHEYKYEYTCPGQGDEFTLKIQRKTGEKHIKIKSSFKLSLLVENNGFLDLDTILQNNQSIIEVRMEKKSYPSGFYNKNDIIKVPYINRKIEMKIGNKKQCILSLSLDDNFKIKEELKNCWKAVFSWGGKWGEFSPNIENTQCERNTETGHSNEIVCLVDQQYEEIYDKKLYKYINKLKVSKSNSTTGKEFNFLPDNFDPTDMDKLKKLQSNHNYKYIYAYKTNSGLGQFREWNATEKFKGIKNIFDNPIPESIVINIEFPDKLTKKCQPKIKTWEHYFFKDNKKINPDDYKPQCKNIKINYSKGIPAEIINELKVFSITKVGNVENKEDITNSCNDKNICQVSNSVANISIKLPFELIKEKTPTKVANEINISLNNFKIVFPNSLKNALLNSNIYQKIDKIKLCFSEEDCKNKTGTVIGNAKTLDDLNISKTIDKLPFGVLISYKNNEECFQEVKGGLILNIPLKNKIDDYSSILKTHTPEPIRLPVSLLNKEGIPENFTLMFYENEDRCNKISSSAPFSYNNSRLSNIKKLPKCIGKSKTFYTNIIKRGEERLVSLCSKAEIKDGNWVINLKRPTVKKPIHFLIVNNENLKDKVGGKKIFNSFIKSLVKTIHVYRLDDSAGIVEKSQEVLSENSVESLFTYPIENNPINAYKIMRHYITDENYEKLKKINKIYVLTDSMPKEYIKGGEAAKLDNYFNQNNKLQYLSFNCANAVEKIGVKKSCKKINSLNDVKMILESILD